eukprot:gene98-137_t
MKDKIVIDAPWMKDSSNPKISVQVTGERNAKVCFFLIHGAGSSSYTWHNQLDMFCRHAVMIAPDLRSHGDSSNCLDMTLDSLVLDAAMILSSDVIGRLIMGKCLILVGHSLGGAIAVRLCHRSDLVPRVAAVIVLDMVEGTALQSIPAMESVLASWPTCFSSVGDCIAWSNRVGRPFSRASAHISIPSLLVVAEDAEADREGEGNEKTKKTLTWRTRLVESKDFWCGWFTNFNDAYLSLPMPHLLVLSTADILDSQLTIAKMQGKLEISVIGSPGVGHFLHEDCPDETATIWVKFLSGHGFVSHDEANNMLRACLSAAHRRMMPPFFDESHR